MNVQITKPVKEKGHYKSIISDSENRPLDITFEHAVLTVVEEKTFVHVKHEADIDKWMAVMQNIVKLMLENQIDWFQTSSLRKETCDDLISKCFSTSEDGSIKIPIQNTLIVIRQQKERSIVCTVEELHFYRASIHLLIVGRDLECLIEPEERNEIVEMVEPDISVKDEVLRELEKHKLQLQKLREESRQNLQNYHISKARYFEKKKELSILEKHFTS